MSEDYQIDQSLGYGVSILYALMKAEMEGRFKAQGYDITVPQWILLNRLWEKDGVSQSELVEVTWKDKTNIARMVARLEEKGLVERQRGGRDHRQQCVYLTPAGRQLEHVMKPLAAQMLQDSLRGIPEDALATVQATLWQVIRNLTEIEE